MQLCLGAKGGTDALAHASEALMQGRLPSIPEEREEGPARGRGEEDIGEQQNEEVIEQGQLEQEEGTEAEVATLFLDAANALPNMEKCNALARVRVDWPAAARAIYRTATEDAHQCCGEARITAASLFGHEWKRGRKWVAPWPWGCTA